MPFTDTNFLRDLGRGTDAATDYYRSHTEQEYLGTSIIAYELFGGFVEQDRADELDQLLYDLEWITWVGWNVLDAREAALIENELAREGRPLSIPDMMIAAAARQRNEPLITADSAFQDVEGLSVINYRTP